MNLLLALIGGLILLYSDPSEHDLRNTLSAGAGGLLIGIGSAMS